MKKAFMQQLQSCRDQFFSITGLMMSAIKGACIRNKQPCLVSASNSSAPV